MNINTKQTAQTPIIVTCNVGLQDLRFNLGTEHQPNFRAFGTKNRTYAETIAESLRCKPGVRAVGEELLRRVGQGAEPSQRQKHLQLLRFPMIRSALEHVLERHSHIDRLILVATNQDDPQFNVDDTVHAAQVVGCMIHERFGQQVQEICYPKIEKTPHLDEPAMKFFRTVLEDRVPAGSEVYAFTSAGISSMNDSLKDQLILLATRRTPPLTVHLHRIRELPEKDLAKGQEIEPIEPDAVTVFLRDFLGRSLMTLIEHYDYSGTLAVLQKYHDYNFWDRAVEAALEHASHRLNLNFHKAADVLRERRGESPFKEWHHSTTFKAGVIGDHYKRLVELHAVIEVKYDEESWADLVWRVASFYETARQLVLSQTLDLSLDDLKENRVSVAKLKRYNPNLNERLNTGVPVGERRVEPAKTPSGRSWKVDRRFLMVCTDFAGQLKGKPGIKNWIDALQLLGSLDPLYDLRNEILHNLAGVSRQIMNLHFRPVTSQRISLAPPERPGHEAPEEEPDNLCYLLPTISSVLDLIGKNLKLEQAGLNPYKQINAFLKQQIEEGNFAKRKE